MSPRTSKGRDRARDHAELLAGTADQPQLLAGPAGMTFVPTSRLLTELEGERIISLADAARLNDVSVDTLKRRHADKILQMSDRRYGMRLKHALTLAQPLVHPTNAA
jgi:hypothetical protein